MELDIFTEGHEYISASRASQKTGYASDYIGQLCRTQKIAGKLVGRTWYVDLDQLLEHKRSRHLGRSKKIAQTYKAVPTVQIERANITLRKVAQDNEHFMGSPFAETAFVYDSDHRTTLPLLSKAGRYVEPFWNTRIAREAVALTLALILVVSTGVLSLEKVNPKVAQSLQNFSSRLIPHVEAPEFAAASLFAPGEGVMAFFTNGFQNLKQYALGSSQIGGQNPVVRVPKTSSEPTDSTPNPPSSGSSSVAVTETTNPYTLDSIRGDLKSELESYVRTQLSLAESPRVIYQSAPAHNPALRDEILVADTRPIVTRQSDSDVSHISSSLSSNLNSLTNGGTFTDSTLTGATISGPSANFTALNFTNATGTSLYLSGNATIDGNLNVGSNTVTLGQLISTRVPTLAHVFTPSWPAGTSNASDATIYINPASADPDTNIFAAAVADSVKFLVDAEGDVYANNLILSGSTSQGETNIAGNLSVQDNSILGDASTDTVTLNSQLLALASSTFQNFTAGNSTSTNATTTSLFSNTAVFGGALSFTGATNAGLRLNNLSNTERDLLTPALGSTIYNTTDSKMQVYTGTWKNVGNPEIGGEVTSSTGGSVLFVDNSGNLAQDNTNFFWDDALNKLAVLNLDVTNSTSTNATTTNSYFSNSLTGPASFTVNSSGKVGIGTLNPNNLLQVADLVNFENNLLTTKLGYQAGKNHDSASYNTFVGYQAGLGSSGGVSASAAENVALGYQSLYSNIGGNDNMAIGPLALYNNTYGDNNTAVGTYSLYTNNTGSSNSAIGLQALYRNQDGSRNIGIGEASLFNNVSGTNNIAIGYSAGKYETGSNALYIDNLDRGDTAGDKAGALVYGVSNATPSSQLLTLNASTTIAQNLSVLGTGNNYFAGNVSLGTTDATEKLTINGNVAFTGGSKIKDTSGKLELQAGGAGTGSSGTGSIYFLDSAATVRGRVDTTGTTTTVGTGTGADGSINLTNATSNNCNTTAMASGRTAGDCVATALTSTTASGSNSVVVSSATGFAINDEILIIQMTGTGAGLYEFKKVSAVSGSQLSLASALNNTYTNDSSSKPQVIRVPQYTSITLSNSGTSYTASAWDGATGGVVVFRATGTLTLNTGTSIIAAALGFSGGSTRTGGSGGNGGSAGIWTGTAGSSGNAGSAGQTHNGSASNGGATGGAGGQPGIGAGWGGGGAGGTGGGGAGGSYGSTGANGTNGVSGTGGAGGGTSSGAGGTGAAGIGGTSPSAYGTAALSTMFLGSGGGSGASGAGGAGGAGDGSLTNGNGGGAGGTGGAGGRGGGIVFVEVNTIDNAGSILATGSAGSNGGDGVSPSWAGGSSGGPGGGAGGAAGGGGAGGSLYVKVASTVTAMGTITASGGSGGSLGGNGGAGANNSNNPGGGGGAGRTGGAGGTSGNGHTNATAGASVAPGPGGAGGDGRVRCDTPSGSCTTTPSANQNVYTETTIATANGYGTFYIGSINTVSADLAEYYVTGDRSLEAGDLVCLSNTKLLDDGGEELVTQGVLRKCKTANDRSVIGIISTAPGVALGSIDSETHKEDNRVLALAGRVPTKVSTENGDVQIGDYLTSSSIPGVAMKATGFTKTVGIAMENFTASSTEVQTGKITAFVNLSSSLPTSAELVFDEFGRLTFGTASTTASTTASSTDSFALSSVFTKIWETMIKKFADVANGIGEFFANRIHTKELCVGDGVSETCITKAQLDTLLVGSAIVPMGPSSTPEVEGNSASTTPEVSGSSEGTSTTTESVVTEVVDIPPSNEDAGSSTTATSTNETIDSTSSTGSVVEENITASGGETAPTDTTVSPTETPITDPSTTTTEVISQN